jgi:hypothetical protein
MIGISECSRLQIGQHELNTTSQRRTENDVPHNLLGHLVAKEPSKTVILWVEIRMAIGGSMGHTL